MRKIIDSALGLLVMVTAANAWLQRSLEPAATSQTGSGSTTVTTDGSVATGRALRREATSRDERDGRDERAASRPARWKEILTRVVAEMKEDNLTTIAAAMTYYGLLALFPGLIAVVSLYGLMADPAVVQQQVAGIADVLPADAAATVTSQLDAIVASSRSALGLGFVVSVAATLWTASSGVAALIKAINITFDETETRSFLKLRLLAFGLTIGIIGFVLAAVFVITALPAVLDALGVTTSVVDLFTWLRWPALGIALILGLAVFYRLAPNRSNPKWRWITTGAVTATVLWLLASYALSFYVGNFGSYNETYGALGSVIVLLLWMYVSSLIVLLGAELDSELEAMAASAGSNQPAGRAALAAAA